MKKLLYISLLIIIAVSCEKSSKKIEYGKVTSVSVYKNTCIAEVKFTSLSNALVVHYEWFEADCSLVKAGDSVTVTYSSP